MSYPGAGEVAGEVRLRKPERRQMAWVPQCTDDLVAATHGVRTVAAVVAKLDLSAFREPIKAREGVAGRDATDPELLVALWLYGCIRGIGSARELARRCAESAPFRWLCGGVGVNHRMLSDFRTDHGEVLDQLFTQVIASLVDQELVSVSRVSQDGLRVRVSAGAGSFRREERLRRLLAESQKHVEELRRQVEEPEMLSAAAAKKKKGEQRVAQEKQRRLEQALAQLPELQQRQQERASRAGQGKYGQKIREQELRVSTSDPQARVMKMPNGGYNAAYNVQVASDPQSRAIVGVEVSNQGYDSCGLSEAMRGQVERAAEERSSSSCWTAATCATGTSNARTNKRWSYSCRPKERARRRIAGESWNFTEKIAQRCKPGSSAWPARKDRKFTGSGQPPAKRSMRTCAVIGA
jgi:transposase